MQRKAISKSRLPICPRRPCMLNGIAAAWFFYIYFTGIKNQEGALFRR